MKQGGKTAVKEENNTEKKEFPKDIDYVNPYVGLTKSMKKIPTKIWRTVLRKKRRSSLLKNKNRKKTEKADGYLA